MVEVFATPMLQLSRVRSLASGSSGMSKAAEVRGESGRQRMEARYMFNWRQGTAKTKMEF